jgi:hypothetical protein
LSFLGLTGSTGYTTSTLLSGSTGNRQYKIRFNDTCYNPSVNPDTERIYGTGGAVPICDNPDYTHIDMYINGTFNQTKSWYGGTNFSQVEWDFVNNCDSSFGSTSGRTEVTFTGVTINANDTVRFDIKDYFAPNITTYYMRYIWHDSTDNSRIFTGRTVNPTFNYAVGVTLTGNSGTYLTTGITGSGICDYNSSPEIYTRICNSTTADTTLSRYYRVYVNNVEETQLTYLQTGNTVSVCPSTILDFFKTSAKPTGNTRNGTVIFEVEDFFVSPTPTPTLTPTMTLTPTPTPTVTPTYALPTIRYRYKSTGGTSISKTMSNMKAVITYDSTSYTFTRSNLTTSSASVNSLSSSDVMPFGTIGSGGFFIYRNICKATGALTRDYTNIRIFINGVQSGATYTNNTNTSISTCPTNLSESRNMGSRTINAGDEVIVEWEDVYVQP